MKRLYTAISEAPWRREHQRSPPPPDFFEKAPSTRVSELKPIGGKRLDPLDLIRWCESHLAYFQIPRYVELVDDFPRTPTERIRKDQLSTSVAGCFDLEHSGYRVRRS